jgi:hypothetical protein
MVIWLIGVHFVVLSAIFMRFVSDQLCNLICSYLHYARGQLLTSVIVTSSTNSSVTGEV